MNLDASDIFNSVADIRKKCTKRECISWTSLTYQNDILRFIIENRDRGGCVVEVGCFRGGLSVQLAYLCKMMSKPFYTMDIDDTAISMTTNNLELFELKEHTTVFKGDLRDFATSIALPSAPVLIVIDGDHAYEAVKRDIKAVSQLDHAPFALAFHDFCLRSSHTDERVDDAVRESFPTAPRIPMGTSPEEDPDLPTMNNPSSDGHYWKRGGSEGCFVIFPEKSTKPNGEIGLFERIFR